MVVEICSENCGVPMSPRISFSHDFSQLDVIPVEKHPLRSNSSGLSNKSSIDFDFCVNESLDHESSSADELFSDGRILPIEIKNNNKKNKKKNAPLNQTGQQQQQQEEAPQQPPLPPTRGGGYNNALTRKNSRKEKEVNNDEVVEKHGSNSNSNSKSFWRFRRSSSCGSGYGRSLCPLPLLSRSNSTGSSSPSVKRVSISKDGHGANNNIKQNSQKNCHNTTTTRSSSSHHHSFGPNYSHQIRPPLKRSHGPYGSNNNNNNRVRINPVLNVPPVNLYSRDKCKRK